MEVRVYPLSMRHPADLSGLRALVEQGQLKPEHILCVIGKTEGNGGKNDFTRDLAMQSLEVYLGPLLRVAPEHVQERVIFSFSGGCEGITHPHMLVFAVIPGWREQPVAEKRLVVGTGYTRHFLPQEIGRRPQILETARVIREIAANLRLDSSADIHLVQMKGAIPAFTWEAAEQARRAETPLRCDMVYSRGASALGAALATERVQAEELTDAAVCAQWELYSDVASVSAKPGLERTEIMVLGNSRWAHGTLAIGHTVLQDLLDSPAALRLLRDMGIPVEAQASAAQAERILAVFAKSEADPRGAIRNKRHTMLSDANIDDTRYSRCVLASVLASVVGHTRIYVSTRAEHHGPLGGGPLSIIMDSK